MSLQSKTVASCQHPKTGAIWYTIVSMQQGRAGAWVACTPSSAADTAEPEASAEAVEPPASAVALLGRALSTATSSLLARDCVNQSFRCSSLHRTIRLQITWAAPEGEEGSARKREGRGKWGHIQELFHISSKYNKTFKQSDFKRVPSAFHCADLDID